MKDSSDQIANIKLPRRNSLSALDLSKLSSLASFDSIRGIMEKLWSGSKRPFKRMTPEGYLPRGNGIEAA